MTGVYPNLDAEDLETRVRTYLNEATAKFYTQSEVWRWLSFGAKDISEKALCVRRILDAQTGGGTRTVPVSACKVLHVEYIPSTGNPRMLRKIDPLRIGHFTRKDAGPHYWYEFASSIGIDPLPAAVHDLRVYVADRAKMVIISSGEPTEGVGATQWTAEAGWVDGAHTGVESSTVYNTALTASTNYTVEFKIDGIGTGGTITPHLGTSDGYPVTRNGYHAQTITSSAGAPDLKFTATNSLTLSDISLYKLADFAATSDQTDLPSEWHPRLSLYAAWQGLLKNKEYGPARMLEAIHESEIMYLKQTIVDIVPDGRDVFNDK